MRIYTKTGDKGTTGLHGSKRLPKTALVFDVLGTNDELSSHIGMARSLLPEGEHKIEDQLATVQQNIQTINSRIASKIAIANPEASELEGWIDEMDLELPPLRSFILPSGGVASSQLHIARAVCRRAERLIHQYFNDDSGHEAALGPEAVYMNRLSDYLFTVARHICHRSVMKKTGCKEQDHQPASAILDILGIARIPITVERGECVAELRARLSVAPGVRLLHDGELLRDSSLVPCGGSLLLAAEVRGGGQDDDKLLSSSMPATLADPDSLLSSSVASVKSVASSIRLMTRCTLGGCSDRPAKIVGDCRYCGGHFCSKHRLPEAHECERIEHCREQSLAKNTDKLMSGKCVADKM